MCSAALLRRPYPVFDTTRVRLRPLAERQHDLDVSCILPLRPPVTPVLPELRSMAQHMHKAKIASASTVFLCGAHVLRAGVQRYIFDMMERGYIQAIAVNGAAMIHDYELALIGATTESVGRYIQDGQFGMWQETGEINAIIKAGQAKGLGLGESLGQTIYEGNFPHKDISLFAAGWKLGIPITVHVGVGYDIIHPHPNFDGAATGAASQRDFLIFAKVLENLEGGCVCTFGSAVMAPEVFLKALSLVRNVATQEGRVVQNFDSLVCDLHALPQNISHEAEKNTALYYFRPWKTLLARTVAQGGRSYYVQARHEQSIPALWQALVGKR